MLLSVMLFMFTLTGCGGHLQTFVETDLRDMITSRIVANQSAATQLYNAGLMTELEYKTIMSALSEKERELLRANEGDRDSQTSMFSAIATFRKVPWVEVGDTSLNSSGYTRSEWNEYIATNAIDTYYNNIPGNRFMNTLRGSGTVVPISIIDDSTGADINKRFGFPIYVLKTTQDISGNMTEMPLDEISELVSKAIADPSNIDLRTLDRYFTPALDSQGNQVTLLDTSKRENKIVVTSDGASEDYVNHPDSPSNPNRVLRSQRGNTEFTGQSYTNRPGKDMIVRQEGYDIFSLRFNEFNQDAIDKVIRTLGLTDSKYLVTADGDGGRVYLLEYPAHYVESFEEDGNTFKSNFAQSNLGINLRTGRFIKYSGAWKEELDGKSLTGIETVNEDPYLTIRGAKSNLDIPHASFSLYGNTEIELGESGQKVESGRIVLRDYLEATYAPNVVPNENVALFGRKIRIENFSGSKDRVVASYYDKNGKKMDIGGNLYINDFADIQYLKGGSPELRFIKGNNEQDINRVNNEQDIGDGLTIDSDENPTNEELIQDAIRRIDYLDQYNTDKIYVSAAFPSKGLGRVDNYENDVPYFYTMAVKKNIFETGLFSGWILNTASEENSLTWWNDWLRENNFKYKLDKTILEDYLRGNYSYEMNNQGIVVLDLEVINKITQGYKEEDVINQNRLVRTGFMLLGTTMLGYSLLMMLAWVLDTNVDLGMNILEKMTFGKMVAVVDDGDMPAIDTEGRMYIGFGKLVIKCLSIVVMGVVLIIVDHTQIIGALLSVFGGIARLVSEILGRT